MTDSSGIDPALLDRATARFAERFGDDPAPTVAVAPGRVNLIGEHTDYNDGFVLPMAIGRAAVVVFRARSDRKLRLHAVAFDETKELALDSLAAPGGDEWFSYVAGVAWAFASEGLEAPGLDAVVDGDVPLGAGLSSSAALEMATARALCAAVGPDWNPVRMAKRTSPGTSWISSRSMMWARCASTVFTLTSRSWAISLVERPSATSCRISRWRGVRPISGSGSVEARR